MDIYGSNSHKVRDDERKKCEKVVTTPIKTKEKSGVEKLADNMKDVKSYLLSEVIIPAVKAAVSDVITNGIDIVLYGESRHSQKSKQNSQKTSYNSYCNSYRDFRSAETSSYSCKDIIFDNRGEAEMVLAKMEDIIAEYGTVSVADFYDLVGVTGRYTDNKGTTDLIVKFPEKVQYMVFLLLCIIYI